MHQDKEKGNLVASNRKQESPIPMTTITELSQTLQTLLSSKADEVAKKQDLSDGNGK